MKKNLYSTRRSQSRAPRILATVLILIGLALLVGGIQLITLAGSLYYCFAGMTLLVRACCCSARIPGGEA